MGISLDRLKQSLTVTLTFAGIAICGLAAIRPLAAASPTESWSQYRGNLRDGVSPDSGLLVQWPAAGPRQVWKVRLGEGFSAISVVGSQLFTMLADDKKEYAAAFDVATGKELWRVELGKIHVEEFGNGPRSTPTVAGDLVYFLSSKGHLAALRSAGGEVAWEVDFIKTFGSEVPYYGYSSSPIIEGDLLVVDVAGGEGKEVIAFDRLTGEVRWSVFDAGAPFASAIATTISNVRQLVLVADNQAVGLSPGGNIVWSWEWPTVDNVAMPVFIAPDKIFLSESPEPGAVLLQISISKQGVPSIKELWRNPKMRNYMSSSVLFDGHLYGFDNSTLRCISLESGKQRWAKRGFGTGSLIAADGQLLIVSDRCKLVLAEATPNGYRERGSCQPLQGKCWTTPSLASGKLYLRNHSEMVSLELKGSQPATSGPKG